LTHHPKGVVPTSKGALTKTKGNYMITTTLDSTFLQEATYDSSRRMLTVVFKNGRTYSYQNVDKTVYDGLINARSSSRFFGANIRGQFTTGS
tara:strand:- start:2686 stop:2961 length:276 start_codon:yes stop_codon:yes gene_type:complete